MILLLLNLWLLNVYFLAMKLVTHWSDWLTSKLLTIYSLMKWFRRLFVISYKLNLWLWSKQSQFENLMIIIIFFDSYKYHVILFKLINELTFYQHYMNNVLFKYLHQFCQIYLNDIIIYSKILKKHKQHVWLILSKLREADLQINIDKCKFHVQKIIFLELLMSIKKLKMNSRKCYKRIKTD